MQPKIRWMAAAVAAIWLAVLLVSLFAPHFISGSQQEHIPIAALVTWISGAAATRSVLNAMLRRQIVSLDQNQFFKGVTVSVAAIWVVVTLVSIFVPPILTGSDPTHIPLAAILAPIAGAIVTGTVAQFVERAVPTEGVSNAKPAVHCPNCTQSNPSDARFCMHCGSALPTAIFAGFCPKCGARASAGSEYCTKCGAKLVSA